MVPSSKRSTEFKDGRQPSVPPHTYRPWGHRSINVDKKAAIICLAATVVCCSMNEAAIPANQAMESATEESRTCTSESRRLCTALEPCGGVCAEDGTSSLRDSRGHDSIDPKR